MDTKQYMLFDVLTNMGVFLRYLNSIVAHARGSFVFLRACNGWVGLLSPTFARISAVPQISCFIKRPNHHRSRAVDDVSGPNKLAEGCKPKISYKDLNLNNNVSIAVENALIYTDKEG